MTEPKRPEWVERAMPVRRDDRMAERHAEVDRAEVQVKELVVVLEQAGFPAPLAERLAYMCQATKERRSLCPKCGTHVLAEFPDEGKQTMESMKLLMAYLRGRPVERQEIAVVATTASELAGLSRKELERIAAGE